MRRLPFVVRLEASHTGALLSAQQTSRNQMVVRLRRAKALSLSPRYFGVGYDSGFYDGGKWLFIQIGHRCWGLWWE